MNVVIARVTAIYKNVDDEKDSSLSPWDELMNAECGMTLLKRPK